MYSSPIQQNQQQVVYGSNNWATRIYGVAPDYLTIRDIRIEEGEPFTTDDVKSTNKVALLGKTVVDNIFAGEDPIGKTIRIRKVPFTVVGTLVPKGQNSSGQDQDDLIIMPITTAKKKVMGGGTAEQLAANRPDHGTGPRRAECQCDGRDRGAAAPAPPPAGHRG